MSEQMLVDTVQYMRSYGVLQLVVCVTAGCLYGRMQTGMRIMTYRGADSGSQDIDGHEADTHHTLQQERVCQHKGLVWDAQGVICTYRAYTLEQMQCVIGTGTDTFTALPSLKCMWALPLSKRGLHLDLLADNLYHSIMSSHWQVCMNNWEVGMRSLTVVQITPGRLNVFAQSHQQGLQNGFFS